MTRAAVEEGLQGYRNIDKEIRLNTEMSQEDRERAGLYEERDRELRAAKGQILDCLNELPYLQRDIIWRHYIKGEFWIRIAQDHHYSERQIRSHGAAALDAMGELLEKRQEAAGFFRRFEGPTP